MDKVLKMDNLGRAAAKVAKGKSPKKRDRCHCRSAPDENAHRQRQPTGGFEFLGCHFERGYRWPRKKSLDKLKEVIRIRTRRNRPGSMPEIVTEINRTIQGWDGYFKHSIANIFPELDSWIRARLSNVLRKPRKRQGRARGSNHQIWPNAYFAELGLISLASIRAAAATAQ